MLGYMDVEYERIVQILQRRTLLKFVGAVGSGNILPMLLIRVRFSARTLVKSN